MRREVSFKESIKAFQNGQEVTIFYNPTNQKTYVKINLKDLAANGIFLISDEIPEGSRSNEKDDIQSGKSSSETKEEQYFNKQVKEYEKFASSNTSQSVDTEDLNELFAKSVKISNRKGIDFGKLFALKHVGWSKREIALDLNISYPTLMRYWDLEDKWKEFLQNNKT